jgi:hypothetical protein
MDQGEGDGFAVTVSGEGAWIRNADGGSGTWRGLSLNMVSPQTVSSAGVSVAVAFDTTAIDTDSIASAGTETFPSPEFPGFLPDISYPAGSCGVVPAGMAGLWRLGAAIQAYSATQKTYWHMRWGLLINGVKAPVYQHDGPAQFGSAASFLLMPVPSDVWELAEGDVVGAWLYAPSSGGADNPTMFLGGGDTLLRTAHMLMEFLGPAP